MNFFYNLKISAKIVIGFLIVTILTAAVGIVGVVNLNSVNSNSKKLYEENTVPLGNGGKLQNDFLKIRVNVRQMLLVNVDDRSQYKDTINSLFASANTNVVKLQNEVKTTEEKETINNFKTALQDYQQAVNQIVDYALQSKDKEALDVLNGVGVSIGKSADEASLKLYTTNINSAKNKSDDNTSTSNRAKVIMIIIVIAVAIIAILLGMFISRVISRPLNKLLNVANNISDGDLNVDFDIKTNDEIGELSKAFEKVVKSLLNLVSDVNILSKAAAEGKLDVRADATKHKGEYRNIIEGVNNTLEGIAVPFHEASVILNKMAVNDHTMSMSEDYNGIIKEFAKDINAVRARLLHITKLLVEVSLGDASGLEDLLKVGKRSENDKIVPALITMMTTIQNLINEVNRISDFAAEGNLEARGDSSKFQGGYRKVIDGFNNALEAIAEPINEARVVLAKMATNDLKTKMKDSYNGMMKELAEDVNLELARLNNLASLLKDISAGDISRLEELSKIGRRSENDELMPATILMMRNIQNLIDEASMIADSAVKGDLHSRSNVSSFQGGYRQVLEGFNEALDAMEKPIKEAEEVLKEMASGNLCVSMEGNYLGSYKIIKDSLNNTLNTLNEFIGKISEASEQVSSGSTQVSNDSQALSQGATEQASAIEELNSTITEVAAQTKQNASNATQANQLALDAKDGASLGNVHMKEMLKSMDEINESSTNISKIIKVIDDIAFQTNILALNAAVEAARAGQHGKGFAVVAEEVRNLAARSASAAKETTDLIEGSINKVEAGTKIANDTAESLDKIVEGVTKAATLVGEIANASNEQATAISQINKGIEQVSDVIQTNSATAEQSATASEELSSQSEILKGMVKKFKLKKDVSISHHEMRTQVSQKLKKSDLSSNSEIEITKKNKPQISLSDTEFGKY